MAKASAFLCSLPNAKRWHKGFHVSGCMLVEKKIIVHVCGYVKSDSYWEGSEAPWHCSHVPTPLATLMALPYPYLIKYEEGKKKKG